MELLPKNATGFILVTLHLQFYLYPIPTKLEYFLSRRVIFTFTEHISSRDLLTSLLPAKSALPL
jgi:hypothetical protein